MIFNFFSYYFHILGPGTRAQAPKRRHGARGLGPVRLFFEILASGDGNLTLVPGAAKVGLTLNGEGGVDLRIVEVQDILFIMFCLLLVGVVGDLLLLLLDVDIPDDTGGSSR